LEITFLGGVGAGSGRRLPQRGPAKISLEINFLWKYPSWGELGQDLGGGSPSQALPKFLMETSKLIPQFALEITFLGGVGAGSGRRLPQAPPAESILSHGHGPTGRQPEDQSQ